ncbi:MAG: ankyrin repeat domain-containing protein [Bacteroidota bacterium]
MSKYYSYKKHFIVFFLFLSGTTLMYAQGKAAAKPGAAKGKPVPTKATLAADMDCSVKINGAAKLVMVKAYSPTATIINVGENYIEAASSDKKSTFNTTVIGKAGESVVVEISFFDDSKFLEYIKQGNISMVETAIKKDPALATNENQTLTTSPLETAIQNSQIDIVKLLMANGASFTSPDNVFPLHKTALHSSSVAKVKGKPAPDRELAEYFLGKGCKVSDKDDGGNTPLHSAVRGGKLDLVKFLIEKGAEVNAKNDFDDTPLKIAEDKGYVSIIEVLRSKGAVDK